jgi:hypothetical protein
VAVSGAARRSVRRYPAMFVCAIVLKISPRIQSEDFALVDFWDEDELDFSDEDELVFREGLLSEPPLADEPLDEPPSDEGAVEAPLVEDPLPADSALGLSPDLSLESSADLALPARA